MDTYQTSATVEGMGEIKLVGVPFVSGTRVAVTLTPTGDSAARGFAEPAERVQELFASLDVARNTQSVGPLRRDELYDRDSFH